MDHSKFIPKKINFEIPDLKEFSILKSTFLAFEGWIQFDDKAIKSISIHELRHLDKPRHTAWISSVPHSTKYHFNFLINGFSLQAKFDLTLYIEIEDGSSFPLIEISGECDFSAFALKPKISPFLISNLGRSGGQWLTTLLSFHPQIAVLNPLISEPHFSTYYLDMAMDLTDPSSLLSERTNLTQLPHWWLGHHLNRSDFQNLLYHLNSTDFADISKIQNKNAINFCVKSLDEIYRKTAKKMGKKGVQFFCEKSVMHYKSDLLCQLIPSARQIVLVRDFRDLLCSIFSFNQKLKTEYFGVLEGESMLAFLERYFSIVVNSLTNHYQQNSSRIHLVKYEELMRDPENELKSILSFLKLKNDSSCIKDMIQSASAYLPEYQEQHKTKQSSRDSLRRFESEFSNDLEQRTWDLLGEKLAFFGYRR